MYINFWYPVIRSADLGTKPQRVRMLSHDFVIFRDAGGRPAVLSDTCVHRGGSLAGGQCKDDGTVQCPYHGWRFNASGQCTRIPSLGIQAKIPPRARVDAYPVEERYGLVFAFLGDVPQAERPPIMPVDEHEQPGWRSTLVTFEIAYNYERSIENGLDPAHNEYVHPTHGYSGEREAEYRVGEMRPHKNNAWGFGFLTTFARPPARTWFTRLLRRFGDGSSTLEAGSGTYGPNQMWTQINLTKRAAFRQYLFETPIDRDRTRVFLLCERNILFFSAGPLTILNRWLDRKVDQRNLVIAGQDIAVMNHLRPTLTPPSTAKELLMPHDKVIVEYRSKLEEFGRLGWQIDQDAFRAAIERGDVVYAIPCPARRESKAWVLDAVPLVPPTDPARLTLRVAG